MVTWARWTAVLLGGLLCLPAASADVQTLPVDVQGGPGPAVMVGGVVYAMRSVSGAQSIVEAIDPLTATATVWNATIPADVQGAAAAANGSLVYLFTSTATKGPGAFVLDTASQTVAPLSISVDVGPGAAAFAWHDSVYVVGGTACSAPCPVLRVIPVARQVVPLDYALGSVPSAGAAVLPGGDLVFFVAPGAAGGIWRLDLGRQNATRIADAAQWPQGAAAWWADCGVALAGGRSALGADASSARVQVGSLDGDLRASPQSFPAAASPTAVTGTAGTYVVGAGSDGRSLVDVTRADVCGATVRPEQPANSTGAPLPAVHDSDADGVRDESDDCPYIADPGQVDQDGDGVGDLCDPKPCQASSGYGTPPDPIPTCPNARTAQATASPTPRPLADSDGDGVVDVSDNCPGIPNFDQRNQDGDRLGDACDTDMDGDGIVDVRAVGDHATIVDNCPTVYNPFQEDTDHDGVGDACKPPVTVVHARRSGLTGSVVAPTQRQADAAVLPLVLAAALVAVAVGLAFAWPRLRRVAPLSVLLFSRLRQSELLDHPTRAAIHTAIQANPGIHYQALLRTLTLTRGVLEHHLAVLEKGHLVTPHRWKGTLGYFPYPGPSAAARNASAAMRSPLARQIHRMLQERPGYTTAEVAAALQVPYAAVAYHVKRFREAGIVRAMDAVGSTHLYAEEIPG